MSAMNSEEPTQAANMDQGPSLATGVIPSLWSRSLVELLVAQFAFGFCWSTFQLLPKYLRNVLAADASEIGLVTGVGLIAAILSTPLIAAWLDTGARRAPALAGVALISISALGFVLVDRVGVYLLGLRALQGIAFTVFASAMVTRTAEIVPRERLGQAIGYVGLAALVTNALSPLITEEVAYRFGWRSAFLLGTAYGLVAFIPAARVKDEGAERRARRSDWSSLLAPELVAVLLGAVTCGVALGVMFTFTQPLALERGARHVGLLFTGYALAATGVRLLLGRVADRWGRRQVAVVALTAYALVVGFSAYLTPQTLLLVGLGLGTAHGALYPALNALALELSSDADRSLVATAFGGSFSIGYAVSALGLGPVANAFGYPSVFFGGGLLTLAGAVLLAKATLLPHRVPLSG